MTDAIHELRFDSYAPFSRNSELLQRLLTPLNAQRVRQASMQPGHGLQPQSIDLKHETFALHVPPQRPPHGYGLLVFVPPWPQATVPPAWIGTLDHRGIIFVSAANSGNDANVLDRRVPLALLAAWNVMRRYRVDPQRVYIGGFSGGSRVAERVALGYPDLFHGALLIAGSDPLGSAQLVLPPSALWRQFQDTTRLVYLTGQNDAAHLELDDRSRQSMQQACVAHVDTVIEPWVGHDLPSAVPFSRALDRLEYAAPVDAGQLARCRIDVDHALDAQLHKVEQLLAAGNTGAAKALLGRIDLRFGGLAAPRSLSLARKIAAQ
jgi:pimeloyl-ACP methyl ester carboxylesterase